MLLKSWNRNSIMQFGERTVSKQSKVINLPDKTPHLFKKDFPGDSGCLHLFGCAGAYSSFVDKTYPSVEFFIIF